jgi:hypothetical protein
MTQSAEIKKLELELQKLRVESKKLSKSLHVGSFCSVRHNLVLLLTMQQAVTERAFTLAKGAKLSLVQDSGGATHQSPFVLVLIDGSSHKVTKHVTKIRIR